MPNPDARAADAVDGRTLHYDQFYGVTALADDRPILVVHGNCQAESLRVLLADDQVQAVRIPPVFEMTAADLPHLARVLGRASYIVTQPIVPDYRGLPLGTDQVSALLPAGARTVRVPPIRYAGLYPTQAITRVPGEPDPPGVPYYDLRTVLVIADGARPRPLRSDAIRSVAAASLTELRAREERHRTVPVADLLPAAGVDAAHTINHPGNTVLVAVARRLQEALGLGVTSADPGRVLLREIYSPLGAEVLGALGLDGEPREKWLVGGRTVAQEEVVAVQREWLAERPHAVQAALARHAATIKLLWPHG